MNTINKQNPDSEVSIADIPTKDRIMALLSPPCLDTLIVVKDARWIVAHIKEMEATIKAIGELPEKWLNAEDTLTTSYQMALRNCANELQAIIKGGES